MSRTPDPAMNTPAAHTASRSDKDWECFSTLSDVAFQSALRGDVAVLDNHNVTAGADEELEFCSVFAAAHGRSMKAEDALDVGCGSGAMTAALQRIWGGRATDVDLSPYAISLARKRHPECRFLLGDGVSVNDALAGERFDLILFREFHLFTRCGDLSLHVAIIDAYRPLLAPGGAMLIGHARSGGGMRYTAFDYSALVRPLADRSLILHGPSFVFPHRHLRMPPKWKLQIRLFSTAARQRHGS